MAKRISLGPVFESEWLAVSRRWQWYAARSLLVLAVLFALALVWFGRTSRRPAQTVQAQAEIGRLLCGAITATQLAIVLLAAPAATAGAICLDRARGMLAHMRSRRRAGMGDPDDIRPLPEPHPRQPVIQAWRKASRSQTSAEPHPLEPPERPTRSHSGGLLEYHNHRTLPTSGFMRRTEGTCSESCRRSSQ
jgi:hypothetical protein